MFELSIDTKLDVAVKILDTKSSSPDLRHLCELLVIDALDLEVYMDDEDDICEICEVEDVE